ncbi:MAG TPA: hypothetical protein VII63_09230 [Caulobacteraceae bacterium]
MTRPAGAIAMTLALGGLGACAPAPDSHPREAAAAQASAAAANPTPAAPVRHATMICRNSQDGRKVACGTPNAVMVGIKED